MRREPKRLARVALSVGLFLEPASRAVALLEMNHPYGRAIDRVRVLARQSLVSATAVGGAFLGLVLGARHGLLLLAAAIAVQAGFAVALLVAVATAKECAHDLIADGRGNLPLSLVERESERLAGAGRRRQLARSYERVAGAARSPGVVPGRGPGPVGYRSVLNVKVVRELAPEMHDVARLLRGDVGNPRGVLLAQRLLTSGGSPLYGRNVADLRAAIARIKVALEPATHVDSRDRRPFG